MSEDFPFNKLSNGLKSAFLRSITPKHIEKHCQKMNYHEPKLGLSIFNINRLIIIMKGILQVTSHCKALL